MSGKRARARTRNTPQTAAAYVGTRLKPPSSDPMVELLELRGRRAELLAQERDAVLRARASGATWTLIGATLGVSAQAAQQRAARARS